MPCRASLFPFCALVLLGCAESAEQAAVAPEPFAPRAPALAPAVAPTAARATPPAPSAIAQAPAPTASAPPPLSGSTGGPPPFASDAGAVAPTACGPGRVKAKLQAIAGACQKDARSVCGTVTVHAGANGKSVNVKVNVNSTSSTDPFTTCVTRHVNSVEWECATAGSDITVTLDCGR